MATIKSIEEKAKRYDEVIEKLRDFYRDYDTVSGLIDVKEELTNLIPELKESEDEKIKKEIITYIKWCEDSGYCAKEEMTRWIAFLEKHGEQKPTKWSDDDEKNIDFLIHLIEHNVPNHSFAFGDGCAYGCKSKEEAINMLKSLKERVQPQPKQEWSEEDKDIKETIIGELELVKKSVGEINYNGYDKLIDWLKSFKDRVQPKQEWSDVDKNILSRIIDNLMFIRDTISIDPNYAVNISDTEREITWLKSLKYRVQPKQEWSEEDETGLDDALWCCKQAASIAKDENDMGNVWYAETWLKSIRPHNRWKPSEEMLEALGRAIPENVMEISEDEMLLSKLYQGLKYGRVLSKN